MQENKLEVTERDYLKDTFTEKELIQLIGDRDIRPFLNTRNELVQQWGWKENPPTTKEFITKALQEPNIIKRPIFKKGDKLVMGFDEEVLREYFK